LLREKAKEIAAFLEAYQYVALHSFVGAFKFSMMTAAKAWYKPEKAFARLRRLLAEAMQTDWYAALPQSVQEKFQNLLDMTNNHPHLCVNHLPVNNIYRAYTIVNLHAQMIDSIVDVAHSLEWLLKEVGWKGTK